MNYQELSKSLENYSIPELLSVIAARKCVIVGVIGISEMKEELRTFNDRNEANLSFSDGELYSMAIDLFHDPATPDEFYIQGRIEDNFAEILKNQTPD